MLAGKGVVEASIISFLDFSILPNLIELGPNEVFFNHTALLVKRKSLRSILFKESLIFVGIEEGHDHIEGGKNYYIQALME